MEFSSSEKHSKNISHYLSTREEGKLKTDEKVWKKIQFFMMTASDSELHSKIFSRNSFMSEDMSENEEIISETEGEETTTWHTATTNEDDNYHFIIFPKDTQKVLITEKKRNSSTTRQHTARLPYNDESVMKIKFFHSNILSPPHGMKLCALSQNFRTLLAQLHYVFLYIKKISRLHKHRRSLA